MVYVRLEQEWTDGEGNSHPAGGMVDVDAATLARLEAQGMVADPGSSGGGGGTGTDSWIEPTGGGDGTDSWIEPTGGGSGS